MALPSDAIFEILSRTSLKGLDKSKTVSKDWNKLVRSSNFMPTYCKNTNSTSGFYIQYPKCSCYDQRYVSLEHDKEAGMIGTRISDFAKDEVEILASSMQGLLVVARGNRQNRRYHVCKPCTDQCQALPNPKLRFLTVKVALVVLRSEPLRYKIVRLSKGGHPKHSTKSNSYKCEIFDSETWKWKTSPHDLVLDGGESFNSRTQSVEASGLVYWLTNRHVVAFDPTGETHSQFPLPESEGTLDFSYSSLVEFEGKLGLVNSTLEGDAELWGVDDSRTHRWRFVTAVKASTDQTNNLRLKGFYNHDIALFKDVNGAMVFYNLQNSSVKQAVNVGSLYNGEQVFPFRSDCETVNLKGV